MWAIVRALLFGSICAIAISCAAALSAPPETPAGRALVNAWAASTPDGWPATPWREARFDRSWARETWELRGDPPVSGGRRADGFSAQWVLRTGWPLPALQCVRNRLRSLWGQGAGPRSPFADESESLSEGWRLHPSMFGGGGDEHLLVPVTPLWFGLAIDSIAWSIPIFAIGALSRRLSAARKARRRRALASVMRAAGPPSPPAPPPDRSSG
ncbi:MAG: hypothetical protein FJ253_01515 [Phycisphaerae bacterium]|nr:hypothetical protein [Phycisphaerae bacterium]